MKYAERSTHSLAGRLGLALVLTSAALAWAAEREPVLGGACEGCELVFEGLPDSLGAQARIAPTDEPGEPLIIEGIVTDADGEPAAGIIVYAYHTDSTGVYPRASTRHGRLRGWVRTDSTGHYRFDTIRPGAYPERSNPQHVHMHVIEPGVGTYWIDSLHFTDDPSWTMPHAAALATAAVAAVWWSHGATKTGRGTCGAISFWIEACLATDHEASFHSFRMKTASS